MAVPSRQGTPRWVCPGYSLSGWGRWLDTSRARLEGQVQKVTRAEALGV